MNNTRNNPWDVHTATASNGQLHIQGVNHYSGEAFAWAISNFGSSPEFTASRYTFHNCEWMPGARAALKAQVALNRCHR